MRLGLAQIDSRVGDLPANAARIRAAARRLVECDLVLTPELALPGYSPRDLLFDPAFLEATAKALEHLARDLADAPPTLVGTVWPGLHNGAALLQGGSVRGFVARHNLAPGDVHNESRWFVPGPLHEPLEIAGRRVAVLVGEGGEPPAADLLVRLVGSPYERGRPARRLEEARAHKMPLVYLNAAGAQEELILDGGSFMLDGSGTLLARLPRFDEALAAVEVGEPGPVATDPGGPEELFRALVAGIRGFARKNGLRRAVLGLSGGVDSAVVACLAAEALGPEAVTAVALPSRYTDPRSTSSARTLAERLGLEFLVTPLEPLHHAAEATLGPLMEGVAAENVQARLRMTILMAHVNSRGGMLLNTSNRTELALGYGTLHGDLAGALSPLGDLPKTEVYELAGWLSTRIPAFIREREPSAELRPGQVDPFDYGAVAPAVEALLRGLPSGLAAGEEARLRELVCKAEHKRRQGPIVLKVGEHSFGSGRMMPVTAAVR